MVACKAEVKPTLAHVLKIVEDTCHVETTTWPAPFHALMQIAQERQGYFTTKQAIASGYADNTQLNRSGLAGFVSVIVAGEYKTVAGCC